MAKAYIAPILSAALTKFKQIVKDHENETDEGKKRLVVFCEDRLSLVAERAICEAVGGTFSVSVFTLSRFLAVEKGKQENVLTSQGSAMAIRKLIEENADKLSLFRRLSTANAAQEVYDTIALLYSSEISAEDITGVDEGSELLKRKLHDIALLYSAYGEYLKENGAVDRNAYLRQLSPAICASERIKGASVLFLGFNAFTASVRDCVRACMRTARQTYGIFIGDKSDVRVYQNEASTDFIGIAAEFGERVIPEYLPSNLPPEAELLRRNVFNPDSLNKNAKNAVNMDICADEYGFSDNSVSITEAVDEEEECSFIAAHILKCVKKEGVRPHKISVMLPDLPKYQPILERIFSEYGIPFYVDRRYPLGSHAICSFVCDYLACAADGMRLQSVTAVVCNPLFKGGEKEEHRIENSARDLFINYLLRAASSRGGVTRAVDESVCAELGKGLYKNNDEAKKAVYNAVNTVREKFLNGKRLIPAKGDGVDFCSAIRELLKRFCVEDKLKSDAEEKIFSEYPSVSAMSARAFGALNQVLDEAEKLTKGEVMSVREFIKILKSGLAAAEISLIPPKQDAVFVGDISATANTGSDVIFAAGLTDAVPKASQDTSILTDGELTSLERLKNVSPKISQVNRRVRELTALNVCAFAKRLYLVYPLRSGGEECGRSEIIDYALRLFTIGGRAITPVFASKIAGERINLPYYLASPAAALRRIAESGGDSSENSTVYALLKDKAEEGGDFARALSVVASGGGDSKKSFTGGAKLYGDKVSPTALETFFACPYKCFMQQGLRLEERKEGELRPLDSGNFIHSVLEEVADKLSTVNNGEECVSLAKKIADEKLCKPPYNSLMQDGRGEYTAASLVEEATQISLGMYNQLKNSSFEISATEKVCSVPLNSGLSVGGRIDRVDSCGDMVRVIDYKTGYHDGKAESYYMGLKLQLPLYLRAAAEGKRPAGAYYFPAKVEYSSKPEGAFCLKGFMDGSGDVVKVSDNTVAEKERSAYVDAYLNGKKIEGAMEKEEFADFLEYSQFIADSGAKLMLEGYVAPSPTGGVCQRCAFSGCCSYDCSVSGEREGKKVNCSQVAQIVRSAKDDKEGR